jgi:hypothetical protein
VLLPVAGWAVASVPDGYGDHAVELVVAFTAGPVMPITRISTCSRVTSPDTLAEGRIRPSILGELQQVIAGLLNEKQGRTKWCCGPAVTRRGRQLQPSLLSPFDVAAATSGLHFQRLIRMIRASEGTPALLRTKSM